MARGARPIVLLVICAVVCLQTPSVSTARNIETVAIDECLPGKYFWRESEPEEFYACLTLSKRAIKMRCAERTYMCNTAPRVFQPCVCNGKAGQQAGRDGKAGQQAGRDGNADNSLQVGDKFLDFAKMGGGEGDRAEAMAMMMSTPASRDAGDDDGPAQEWDSMASAGCPDPYVMYPNSHMLRGVRQGRYTELVDCQEACTMARYCVGVDWDKRREKPDDERCFFIYPESFNLTFCKYRYGSNRDGDCRLHDTCCDHYRRTMCQSEAMTYAPDIDHDDDADNRVGDDSEDDDEDSYSQYRNNYVKTGSRNRPSMDITEPTAARQVTVTENTVPPTTTQAAAARPGVGDNNGVPATTIPDSGCPYTFKEFPDVSHPFGTDITDSENIADVEECKYWCLIRSYCRGVDFDLNSNKCYYLAQVEPGLVSTNMAGVTHYRKVDCTRPLMCWEQNAAVTTDADLAITDPNSPQASCTGFCYVKQTMAVDAQTIQRGCTTDLTVNLGCSLSDDMMYIECYCDTMRCNGLSIMALNSQFLHLPLDEDMSDHSGTGHQATVPFGYQPPDFQCLDKAINCSALFQRDQCVSIPSLAQTNPGLADPQTFDFSPAATFSVNFKKINNGQPSIGGIFGNSDSDVEPTWQLLSYFDQGSMVSDLLMAGLISEGASHQALDDFRYVKAQDEAWHQLVLRYDGTLNIVQNRFPTLSLFLDGESQLGNTMNDAGFININQQPVTIGCVQQKNFNGYIDDARVFLMPLENYDIQALKAMLDVNFV